MRRPLIALSIALAAATAACTTAAPSWTYAPPSPPPSGQPAASGGVSAAPSAPASVAPASEVPASGASSLPAPSDGGQSSGGTLAISALNVDFEQKDVTAPADQPFAIAFDNKDAGIPHDIAIRDSNGQEVFKGEIVTGPIQTTYNVGALPPGTYQFVCTVHPNMIGTLRVGG
jgi:plastocyanin